MFKLYEYGELNQSKLMSYCGLNNVKHKEIIDDLVEKDLIVRTIDIKLQVTKLRLIGKQWL